MPAGARNQLVEFQKKEVGEDDTYGAPLETWNTVFKRWCALKTTGSKESYVNNAIFAESSHVFEADWDRSLASISSDYRAKIGSTVYDLKPPHDPYGNHRKLLIPATVTI